MKHALFIQRVNSNVLTKQISSLLVNSRLERNLGAKADPRYKGTRVITRRVLTGLTCILSLYTQDCYGCHNVSQKSVNH